MEDLIGREVEAYRAPGVSITEKNTWAFEVLTELGFKYDCSIFPSEHDYGGFPSFGQAEPVVLLLRNGATLKEFPINMIKFMGKDLVFSGGGFFRLFPYALIRKWSQQSPYLMTYFHTRDFDPGLPMIVSLPLRRRIKSYVGLNKAFSKFQKYLNDFDFLNIQQADGPIDWGTKRVVKV